MTGTQEREKLLEKRRELEKRLDAIKADIRRKLSPDLPEQAIELENREVLMEIARTTQEEINHIDQTLNS